MCLVPYVCLQCSWQYKYQSSCYNINRSWSSSFSLGIYEDVFNDFLEAAFLFNLCILAVGTYHVKESGGSQAGLAYTSVGIALVLFICIVVYHMYLRLRTLGVWKKILKLDSNIFGKLALGHNKVDDNDEKEAGK